MADMSNINFMEFCGCNVSDPISIMCHLSSKSGYPIFLAASSCFRQPVPFFVFANTL